MNEVQNTQYTSNLRMWAVDRAVKMACNQKDAAVDLKAVFAAAEEIMQYCYCPEEEEMFLRDKLAHVEHAIATRKAQEMEPASNRVTQ